MVNNKRLTIIARMDDSGLGHQTRNLVRVLNPDHVVLIDLSFYNGFPQHPEWYEGYGKRIIKGFLSDDEIRSICQVSDVVLTAETFYSHHFVDIANKNGTKTINQINYEFFDPLANRALILPTRILMPSKWHLEDLQRLTSRGKVEYLPPPTMVSEFDEVRETNMNRVGRPRFLHVAGKIAAHDRAGTKDLLECLRFCMMDFELVVKVQAGELLSTTDDRVTFDYSFPEDERDLYKDFDAMIMPRRYAGLNLPMNEALASGLPVIMTDISPNNKILPASWLVPAVARANFVARTRVDVYSALPTQLAARIDQFASLDAVSLKKQKETAYRIAQQEFSPEVFLRRWHTFINNSGVLK